MQTRVFARGFRPRCVGLENIRVINIRLEVSRELLVATLAGDSFLDGSFEGIELRATFDSCIDGATASETIEFNSDIGIKVFVDFFIAVVGPDLLWIYQSKKLRTLRMTRGRTDQLETIAIV